MVLNPSDTWPRSHYDLIEHYNAQYDRQITSGEYQPFLYPWGTFGALVAIVYLLIPHQNRPWLRNCKYPVFAWTIGFAAYTILYTKARLVAASFGIGLISVWSVVWFSAILICNDAQTDFMRIERIEGAFGSPKPISSNNNAINSTKTATREEQTEHDDIMVKGTAGPASRYGQFAWQPYPHSPFLERLDWVLDLCCNFRGAGWNWRTSALPPPPKWLQEQLHRNSGAAVPKHTNRIHASQAQSHPSRTKLLTASTKTLAKAYLALDTLKTVMMWDPYFWGLVDRPPPSHFPAFITHSAKATHAYRIALSLAGVKYALEAAFALGPLFFSGLVGPRRLGARAEPFLYPDAWGPFSAVLEGGLAGWWGYWWHQTFRFALEQPSRKVVELCGGLDRKGLVAKVVQLGIAFGLSGALHAGGSYTVAGDTNPVSGSLVFFLWQGVGILAETAVTRAVGPTMGLGKRVPKGVKRVVTLGYVLVWFYFTTHLVADEAARGGLWLFEPVPVSLLRGIGLGADERDGWWCWSGQLLRWHSGDRWWNSGIAL